MGPCKKDVLVLLDLKRNKSMMLFNTALLSVPVPETECDLLFFVLAELSDLWSNQNNSK